MIEQLYFQKLKDVQNRIALHQFHHIEEDMEELFCYKPVPLLWYVTKADYYFQHGDKEQAWNLIKDKSLFVAGPGMKKYGEIHQAIEENNSREQKRLEFYYTRLLEGGQGQGNSQLLEKAIETYCQDSQNVENLKNLADAYYVTNNMVMYFILYKEQVKRGNVPVENRKQWFYNKDNYGFLEEKIKSKETEYILIADDKNERECDILADLLHQYGNTVFIVTRPIELTIEQKLSPEEYLQISIENQKVYEDAISISPIRMKDEMGNSYDNRAAIVAYICKNKTSTDYAVILATSQMLDTLCETSILAKKIDRLSKIEESFNDKLSFGYAGNYLSYISDIHCMKVEEEMQEESLYDFSIVIPARNSAITLEYTIQTCLNQTYEGTYEIILSDNSSDGNQNVYELYKKMNQPCIHYIKTPRNMNLSKSFEYAVLKARGKFIVTLGADDGALPWMLQILAQIQQQYPDEPVIQWERGFYAWPGFNEGQENQFIIPRNYKKGEYQIHYVKQLDYFAKVLMDITQVFSLPMLYINSGCKRDYLWTVYEKTGKLWDGSNQDMYMGLVNTAINEQILNITYPLTIAGMSSGSIGAVSSKPHTDNKKLKELYTSSIKADNVGVYTSGSMERRIPAAAQDISALYMNMLRLMQHEILPRSWWGELISLKTYITKLFDEISITDINYERYYYFARLICARRGSDTLNWFDNTFAYMVTSKTYVTTISKDKKIKQAYEEKTTSEGGIILNAMKHDVHNIKEAVDLFVKLFEDRQAK